MSHSSAKLPAPEILDLSSNPKVSNMLLRQLLQSIRQRVGGTLSQASEIDRLIKKNQIEKVRNLQFTDGSYTEILLKGLMSKKLALLLQINEQIIIYYNTICIEVFLSKDEIIETNMINGIENNPLLKQIKDVLSFIPFHVYPLAFFFDLKELYKTYNQRYSNEEKEYEFLRNYDSKTSQSVMSSIKAARSSLIQRIDLCLSIDQNLNNMCALTGIDQNTQRKWLLDMINTVDSQMQEDKSLKSLSHKARVQLTNTFMKMAYENSNLDLKSDFQALLKAAHKQLPPDLATVAELKNLVNHMNDSFSTHFIDGSQQILRAKDAVVVDSNGKQRKLATDPDPSEEKTTIPPTQTSTTSPDLLPLAQKYFKMIQDAPSSNVLLICATIRANLILLKKHAHTLVDAELFKFIKAKFIRLDKCELAFKGWNKLSENIIHDFKQKENAALRQEHMSVFRQIKELRDQLLQYQIELKAKEESVNLLVAAHKAKSESNSSSSSTTDIGSGSLFSPSSAEAKEHHEFCCNNLEKLTLFNNYKVPTCVGKTEAASLMRMQIYACLFEIKSFLGKLDHSHAQLLPNIRLEDLKLLLKGLVHAKDLLDSIMTLDRIDKIYTQFKDFSQAFAGALKTRNFKYVMGNRFYKQSLAYAQELEQQDEKVAIKDRAHYGTSLIYDLLLLPTYKANQPEGMLESAVSMMKIHKEVYGMRKKKVLAPTPLR